MQKQPLIQYFVFVKQVLNRDLKLFHKQYGILCLSNKSFKSGPKTFFTSNMVFWIRQTKVLNLDLKPFPLAVFFEEWHLI